MKGGIVMYELSYDELVNIDGGSVNAGSVGLALSGAGVALLGVTFMACAPVSLPAAAVAGCCCYLVGKGVCLYGVGTLLS